MVIVPATTGQMGVLPCHVPTITELKPGVLSMHEGNDVNNYFVSNGFVFVHANSVTDIIVVEAVPVDQIDPSLVQKRLAQFTQKPNSQPPSSFHPRQRRTNQPASRQATGSSPKSASSSEVSNF